MESFWLKLLIIAVFAALIYREILKSAANSPSASRSKAGVGSFVTIGAVVGGFTYLGMSITLIETKDLRPYHLPSEQRGEWVSLYDQGVIELDGMLIKTNLAPRGELSTLASSLVEGALMMDAKPKDSLTTSPRSPTKPITPAVTPKR